MDSSLRLVWEILADNGHSPRFPDQGVGRILAETFNKTIHHHPNVFPHLPRGRTLVMIGDFSGDHRGQHFDTYSFLVLDLDRNSDWLRAQRDFRQNILISRRRMAFKRMNDSERRRALIPFLRMAFGIEGYLILFAISKGCGSMFATDEREDEARELLSIWKPAVQERSLRIIHLSAFVLSGLSAPSQDILWIIDEDEIAANTAQLTKLTEVFARVFSNCASHHVRHLRCGTTQSDDGSLVLEDLAAIPDLTAGAFSEICTGFVDQSRFPVRGLVTSMPAGLTWKSRLIGYWMASHEISAPTALLRH